MSLPAPLPGLVLRYSYLWAADAARGRDEDDKDRPAIVVITIDDRPGEPPRVLALPITHSSPAAGVAAIEIPTTVATAAGLDMLRNWVVLSEFNEFIWPGFDLRLVPGRNPPTVAYGFLTPGFFKAIRDRWLALDAANKSSAVERD